MIGALARKHFGSPDDRRVKEYQSPAKRINALEPELAALSDEALKARTAEFREQLAKEHAKGSELLGNFVKSGTAATQNGKDRNSV
jgi:preprotein translocase subunit SecA